MSFLRRRGRRKSNNPKIDLGTPELREKRRELLGGEMDHSTGCESLLGILWTHGKISAEMRESAECMQEIYYRFRHMFVGIDCKTSNPERTVTEQPFQGLQYNYQLEDLPYETQMHEAWTKLDGFLRDMGSDTYQTVMKVTLEALPYTTLSPKELKQVQQALYQLDHWLRLGKHVNLEKNENGD